MPIIASWVREKDETRFADSVAVAGRPDLVLRNARRGEVPDLSEMDALLITGGEDIAAEYLRQPIPENAPILDPVPERDAWEFAAAAEAIARGLPILGVCKGHQVLNVALGGTLFLHIDGHDEPAQKDVDVQPLRWDRSATEARRFDRVNSSHHQALDRLGDGLVAESWHAGDGIVEGVRSTSLPWAVGVQYHPERAPERYAALFAEFARAVRRGASGS